MSEINVAKLQVGDVPFASNGSQNTGRRPVDARRDVLGKNNLRTTINLLIDQVIEADDQNVKITGDQVINGRKEFTNIVITGASLPITGTEIILNQDSDTQATCKLVVNRGLDSTDASLVFNVSSQIWELFEDESTLSRLRLLDPVNDNEAATKGSSNTAINAAVTTINNNLTTNYLNKTGVGPQTVAGTITFTQIPKSNGTPSNPTDLTTVEYVAGLITSGIFQQNTFPAAVENGVLIKLNNDDDDYSLWRSDGASWFPVYTNIPQFKSQSLSAGAFTPEVTGADIIDIDVTEDFTIENPDFGAYTPSQYDGRILTLRIRQDGTGGWEITGFGSDINFSTDLPEGSVQLSPGAFSVTYIGLRYNHTSTNWDVVAINKGF